MAFLSGKRILITGLLSNRSIAYGIAQACYREGAQLAFTYVGDRFRDRIREFADEFGSEIILPCDVGEDEQIAGAVAGLRSRWDGLDGLVHSIGFAPREAIAGEFLDGLSRENFRIAHEISAYSFPALAKASLEASVRYLANDLGPRGIRVNGISAGPIKTLAASGIKGFSRMLAFNEANAPLRRNVTIDEVGNVAAFLLSDLASGMTGEVVHVDCGFRSVAFGLAAVGVESGGGG